ncbi:MAG: response regulator [Clostridiales Family XIII bacterium]|jgi:two-component system response regulator YesN|nr:response regulator [Clostridiales Family XIII bacterium]
MIKIMIVDNEEAIRRGLANAIDWAALGCEIAAQAEDGIDALEQIPVVTPDIVISDIRMPGMNGLELAKMLYEKYPSIKVILLTGFPDFEYAQKAIEYSVVEFVLKPMNIEDLTRAIEKAKLLIEQSQSSEELMKHIESKVEENLSLQRNLFLNNLVNHIAMSDSYIEEHLKKLDLDLKEYYVIRFEITPENFTDAVNMPMQLIRAQEVLCETLAGFRYYQIPKGERKCYYIVCAPQTDELYKLCIRANDILTTELHIFGTIGLSGHHSGYLQVAAAIHESDQAAQFATHEKTHNHNIVSFEKLPKIADDIIEQMISDLNYLPIIFENKNRDGIVNIISGMFEYVKAEHVPNHEVYNLCLHIHHFCISQLLRNHGIRWVVQENLSEIPISLKQDTIEQMETYIIDFTLKIYDFTVADNTVDEDIIKVIKSHIETHYMENWSLEQLSELVYLSPGYLSKLFKRKTGVNLAAYMQEKRVEVAKVLLRTTELKVHEIAEKVGIGDPVYFARIFKKATGVKPKEWRGNSTGS